MAARLTQEVLLDRLHGLLERHWHDRPHDLRRLDLERDLNPDWFLSEEMVGYVFYIDKFAGRLDQLPRGSTTSGIWA